ncbi:MAG: MFS transporter small subunit [Actinomycetes bacterium]
MSTHDRSTVGAHDRAAVPLAILLWVLVTVALAYGVISTASKVVDLFA